MLNHCFLKPCYTVHALTSRKWSSLWISHNPLYTPHAFPLLPSKESWVRRLWGVFSCLSLPISFTCYKHWNLPFPCWFHFIVIFSHGAHLLPFLNNRLGKRVHIPFTLHHNFHMHYPQCSLSVFSCQILYQPLPSFTHVICTSGFQNREIFKHRHSWSPPQNLLNQNFQDSGQESAL